MRVAADKQVRRVLQRQNFAGAQISILDALLKLRQVCCDPYLVRGSEIGADMERAKLEALTDLLVPLVDEGRRVLVFSQFTGLLELIADALSALRLPFLSLTEQHPPRSARRSREALPQSLEVPVLLVSLKAGGVASTHRRRHRHPHGPVVEPRRGRTSHRPRPPHRPRPAGVRLQAGGGR